MGKVSIVTATQAHERSVVGSGGKDSSLYKKAAYAVDKLPYFPTDDLEPDGLQMFHIDMGPDSEVAPHAHTEDEIIYILTGAIHLGAQVLGPGDALFVGAHTLYGFTVGPEGCAFLNFRGTAKVGYLTKEQFLEQRAAR